MEAEAPDEGAESRSWHIVEAGLADVEIMADFWVRLMEEESPPFFSSGATGRRRAAAAFGRMMAQPDSYRGFLAFDGSDRLPFGFILGSVYDRLYGEPRRAGNILHWYVIPEKRALGMGEALFQKLMEWFEKEQVEVLEVMARKEEARTRAWRARGFEGVLDLFMRKPPWNS